MKRFFAILIPLMMLTMSLSACSSKGKVKEFSTKKAKTESTKAEPTNQPESESVSPKTVPTEETPVETDMNELEQLIDTFNNGETDEEKEAARQELEKIIEQIEAQAE